MKCFLDEDRGDWPDECIGWKMKIRAWQVIMGVLPTQKCKVLRHIPTTSTCRLCGLEEEGTFHALVACEHARNIWAKMSIVWPLPKQEMLVDSGKDWLLNILANCTDLMRDCVIMLVWRIWSQRSNFNHGKEIPNVTSTTDYLQSYLRSLRLARTYTIDEIIKGKMPAMETEAVATHREVVSTPWTPPPVDRAVLSVDGAFSLADGSGAAGMVLMRHDGTVIFAAYRYLFNCNDALEAELHAIMQGMALAIQHCNVPIVVQSDSSVAISSMIGEGLSRSAYGHLVNEIKHLMVDREFIPLKNKREQNRVADRLACYSRMECTTAVWLGRGPPCVEDILPLDCNPMLMV